MQKYKAYETTILSNLITDPACYDKIDGFYVTDELCNSYYRCKYGFKTDLTCSDAEKKYFSRVTNRCQSQRPDDCKGI